MENRDAQGADVIALDWLIDRRLEKIEEIKESLTCVRSMKDEMALLRNLSDEISALRALRDRRFSGAAY